MATFRAYPGAMRHLLTGNGGAVDRHFRPLARRVQSLARAKAPVESGALKGSMRTTRLTVGNSLVYVIGSPLKQAKYTNCGTGVYAGHGPITPKRGQYLVFWIDGRKIVTKSVKGQPAQGYMIEALREGQPYPVTPLPC